MSYCWLVSDWCKVLLKIGFVGLGLAFFRVGLNFKGYLALVKFQVLLKVG